MPYIHNAHVIPSSSPEASVRGTCTMPPMAFTHFSRNGSVFPMDQAVIPFSNVEYAYGFGAYENIRVLHGKILFLSDHTERLMASARIIGLGHPFTSEMIKTAAHELVRQLPDDVYNLKVLLLGAKRPDDAQLIILPLMPHFPEKKLYTQGATAVTFEYERMFPQAKILNMFPSYFAYKQAKEQGCHDALFINRRGCITEGTRSNFFVIKGKTIWSPSQEEILEGVTLKHVFDVAQSHGYEVRHGDIPLSSLDEYDGAFLTSTSSKIVPLKKINDVEITISNELKELMKFFDDFLDNQ